MNRMLPRSARLTGALVGAAVLSVTALAGCGKDSGNAGTPNPSAPTSQVVSQPSGSVNPSANPSGSTTASGSASPAKSPKVITDLNAITVAGAKLQKPVVTADWPLAIAETKVKVLQPGTGKKVDPTGTIQVHYIGINATNGKAFDESYSRKKTATFPLDGVIAGFKKGLSNQNVGSRVLIMMPAKDGYSKGNPDAGIAPTDNLVFVVDIVAAQLTAPEGDAVPPKSGLPTVADNGARKAPTITIGSAAKPGELVVQPLIKGKGPKVAATDSITVNYTAVKWSDGKPVADNYPTGPETGALSSLITGWQKGLVGQTVGSRVLLIVPPAQAYPKGNATPSIPAGETLVYVVDILLNQPGQ